MFRPTLPKPPFMSEKAWIVEVGRANERQRYLVGARARDEAVAAVLRVVGVDALIVSATMANPPPANSPTVKSGQVVEI